MTYTLSKLTVDQCFTVEATSLRDWGKQVGREFIFWLTKTFPNSYFSQLEGQNERNHNH